MRLGRVFSDYMVLQRGKPILIWGWSERGRTVSVKLNGALICERDVEEGDFSFLLPAQEAAEDVLLEIGDIRLEHVDIGEVWVAGGQSNMEFMLQYTQGGEEEMAAAHDDHLRTYIVGQYSFAGEREEGYKAWEPWDRWLPYRPEHAAGLPAVAVYFAKELRRQRVPVGILSCNWGGTSACAWLDREYLLADPELKSYMDDFDALMAGLDLEKYNAVKRVVRPILASPETRKTMGLIQKYTFRPGEMEKMMAAQAAGQTPPESASASGGPDLSKFSVADLMAVGPGDPNQPAALYENMVKEITGYSVRGVIWYQGESDDKKAAMYARLFTALIDCWRRDWKARNAGMDRMPFLFVQLAPFGTWRDNPSEPFPILRQQQELVSRTVPDVYMTSISDIGNVYDIHPKVKKPVGERLARLAEKYVYGLDVPADAPEAAGLERDGDTVKISFWYGAGLRIEERDFTAYNGFPLSDIRADLIPPVLGGVNGLKVRADGKPLENAVCAAEGEALVVRAEALGRASRVRVEFAQTGFYQVNLRNGAGLPAKPFALEWDIRQEGRQNKDRNTGAERRAERDPHRLSPGGGR